MDMNTEPIRLPAWATSILLVIGAPLAAILLGQDPRAVIASAILALVASGGVIGYAESRRARTDSPATIARRLEALSLAPLPEDERDACSTHEQYDPAQPRAPGEPTA